MRHLPNILTLANLFCGCIAIVCILNAQPFLTYQAETGLPDVRYSWVYGVQMLQWGGLLIFIAAFFDLLDGFTSRALKVFSPIGKDLDSLADVVSFGVAPSMILYKWLWDVVAREPNVTDVDMLSLAPAFLLACFAALRLARFNISAGQKGIFTGMPTPAIGLFTAALALADWDNPAGWTVYLQSRWAMYGLIALLCYLMVSKIRFLKLIPAEWQLGKSWPQAALVLIVLIAVPVLRFNALPVVFAAYIILSLAAPKSPAETATLKNIGYNP